MAIKNKSIIDVIKRNDPYFEEYITRSVYHSNAIEGNTLSYYETYQVLFNCSSDEKISSVKPRDLYEAINLKYAMDFILKNLYEPITPEFIIKICKFINKNINEIDSFRKGPVAILGAEHIPPNAADVPRLINELLYTSFKTNDFLQDLAEFHIRYERIHPFGDGNGRSGRVLLNKIALENGYPPFVIVKDVRTAYMNMLADCNVEALKKLIHTMMLEEISRMKTFCIDTSRFSNIFDEGAPRQIEI